MVTPDVVEVNGATMTLAVDCFMCGKTVEFEVLTEGYERRMNGEKIQDCFPNLNPKYRELMISATCPDCWDKMFGEEE